MKIYIALLLPNIYLALYFSDNNLLSRIHNTVSTSMSPMWTDFNSSFALDGKYYYSNFEACRCCSVAKQISEVSWWEIDLKEQYLIKELYVIGRTWSGKCTMQLQGERIIINDLF